MALYAVLFAPLLFFVYNLPQLGGVAWDSTLTEALLNSLLLAATTCVFSTVLAVPMAWSLSQLRGPQQGWAYLLALLPLTFPQSVNLQFLQDALSTFSLSNGSSGKLFMLALSLSFKTHVFLTLCLGFKWNQQLGRERRELRLLDLPWHKNLGIHLGSAKSTLMLGYAWVIIECMGAYELAEILNLNTLDLNLFRATFVEFKLDSLFFLYPLASSILPLLLFTAMMFFPPGPGSMPSKPGLSLVPSKVETRTLTTYRLLVFLFFFALPFLYHLIRSVDGLERVNLTLVLTPLLNSLLISILTALVLTLCFLFFSFALFHLKERTKKFLLLSLLLQFGFSGTLCGSSLLFLPFWNGAGASLLSETWLPLLWATCSFSAGITLLCAFVFLYGTPAKVLETAHLLGSSSFGAYVDLLLPRLKSVPAILLLWVFLRTLHDLPITLLLQPFDFSTLSTKLHQFSLEGMSSEASVYTLVLILISLYPVVKISRLLCNEQGGGHA